MSKLKVAFQAPCIGIGGGDAQMVGLARYWETAECVAIAVEQPASRTQIDWYQRHLPGVPLWISREHDGRTIKPWQEDPRANYADNFPGACHSANRQADIVVSWCCCRGVDGFQTFTGPTVELAQNSDDYATRIARTNGPAADFRVGVSQAAAETFGTIDVKVIHNGADPARILPRLGRRTKRHQWQCTDSSRVVLFCGRFVEEKRPDLIVHALAHLPNNWRAVFVGRGPMREALTRLAETLAPGRVDFEPFAAHVGDYYAAADVFCLPTDFEGDALSIHEAQLAGLPVVTTPHEAIEEHESKHGRMVERVPFCCAPIDLASALQSAVGNGFDKVRQHAQQITWNHFAMPTIAARWEWYLHDCLHAWRRTQMLGQPKFVGPPKRMTHPAN